MSGVIVQDLKNIFKFETKFHVSQFKTKFQN